MTEDPEIGFLGCKNESINLVWRIEVNVPVDMSLAEIVEEVGDGRAGAQRWRVIAEFVQY